MDKNYCDGGHLTGHGYAVAGRDEIVIPFIKDLESRANLEACVRRTRQLRHIRKRLLGQEFCSGPGWEVLLHLFESHVSPRRETIGSVCDGIDLPTTTVIRWIYRLQEEGLVVLRNDHLDGRRRFAELSATGIDTMMKYFAGIAPHMIAA